MTPDTGQVQSDEIDNDLLVMYTHSLGEQDPRQGQAGAALGNNEGYGRQTSVLVEWDVSWFLWENMIGLFK